MAPGISKYVDSRFESLTEGNRQLKNQIDRLTECVEGIRSELQELQFVVSENIQRREMVESNLISVNSK